MSDCPMCSSGEEQETPSVTGGLKKGKLPVFLNRRPFPFHCGHIHSNSKVSWHRLASKSLEGSHRERAVRLLEERERRRQKVREQEEEAAQQKVRMREIGQAAEEARIPGPPGIMSASPIFQSQEAHKVINTSLGYWAKEEENTVKAAQRANKLHLELYFHSFWPTVTPRSHPSSI
ncbi:hypothetical protein M9H77_02124 [Catharanthus roseus]|uniref:Uncharacterized protein n=1 Tax=Catharanthus roseus TaxID=4058 RepID=A0ACC0C7Q1_CATRO|nr:hypothetical protein M9H77_02124 [Catharanthus roseus]